MIRREEYNIDRAIHSASVLYSLTKTKQQHSVFAA